MQTSFKDEIRKMFRYYALIPIGILIFLFVLYTYFQGKYTLNEETVHAGAVIRDKYEQVDQLYKEQLNKMVKLPKMRGFVKYRINGEAIYESFYEFNSQAPVKSVMEIVDAEGNELASSSNFSSASTNQALKQITKRMAKLSATDLAESNVIYYSFNRKTSYTYGKAVIEDNIVLGYIFLQLYEEDIQQLLSVEHNEIAVIVDEYQNVLATTNNKVRGILNKFSPIYDENGLIVLNNVEYVSATTSIPNTNLQIYTLSTPQDQLKLFKLLALFIISAGILLFFFIGYLSRKLATQQTKAIDTLIEAVNEIKKGELTTHVQISSNAEFELLAEHFNEMTQSLIELQHKNAELSELKRVSEMKLLQSQFHPHFIYNVLETLRYSIVLDKDAAQNIVILLSRLLRYSIKNNDNEVKLKQDINYISDYLSLQKIRFDQRLQYEIILAPEVEEALVPRLLLQTIIENSIKYGYKQKESIALSINCILDKDKLVIHAVDDANGMSEERLDEVRRIISLEDNPSIHTGLHNLNRRLKLMYGESHGLEIFSTENQGTTIIISLPYRRERD